MFGREGEGGDWRYRCCGGGEEGRGRERGRGLSSVVEEEGEEEEGGRQVGRRGMRCFTADGVGGGEGVSQRELGLGRDRCKH